MAKSRQRGNKAITEEASTQTSPVESDPTKEETRARAVAGITFQSPVDESVQRTTRRVALPDGERHPNSHIVGISASAGGVETLQTLNEELEQRVTLQAREVKLLAAAISHLGEGVLITSDDLDWPGPKILFVNEAMCRISGYSASELVGQTPRMLQRHETSREALNKIKQELTEDRSCTVELVNYRKDGSPYDAELFITPLLDTQGRRTNFVSIHRDISQRKRTERTLRSSEEQLLAILNTAADAIITIDQRGIIERVNAATERMFGFAHEELVGQNVSILMPPPYRDEHDAFLARYLKTREARIIGIGREAVGRRKDGSTFPIGLAVSEVDHLGLFTGIIRDMSTVKMLQKQVLEIAAEEDRRIGHELHDNVQQQLTGLGLLAQTLAETVARELPQQAKLATRLAGGLKDSANQLHALSRGLVPVEVDAEGLRAALTDLATRISASSGVRCDFRCAQPVELADNFVATHLYRIAQEAVNNALKHSHAEHIELLLAVNNGFINMQVLDNGVGIGEKRDASGIGLQIMQYRADLIGGTLRIAPRNAGGTMVSCTIRQ